MAPKPGTPINTSMGPLEWTLLLSLSLLWGGSFFFNAVAVREIPVFTVVFFRLSLSAVVLLVIAKALGHAMPRGRRPWLAFFFMGAINNAIPFSLIVWGQTHIGAGLAAIATASAPVFAVVIAHVATSDEKFTPNRMIGAVLGCGGVAVLVGGATLEGSDMVFWALMACVGAAISYGFGVVYGRRFRSMGIAPLPTSAGVLTAAAVLLLAPTLLIDQPWGLPAPSPAALWSVLALALLCSVPAYIMYFRILSTAGATNLVLVTVLVPASAIVLGIVFLGETLLARHLLGFSVIILALAIIDGRLVRALRRSAFGAS